MGEGERGGNKECHNPPPTSQNHPIIPHQRKISELAEAWGGLSKVSVREIIMGGVNETENGEDKKIKDKKEKKGVIEEIVR